MFWTMLATAIFAPKLVKEVREDAEHREWCAKNGQKTYIAKDGVARYVSDNRRVTNANDLRINLNKDYYKNSPEARMREAKRRFREENEARERQRLKEYSEKKISQNH